VSKLVRILIIILIAFLLSSLVLYRVRLNTLRPPRPAATASHLVEETAEIEGEIQTIDPGSNTLTLVNGGNEVMLTFDERTSILAPSGKPIKPASIATGTAATVKYAQRGGKKWARKIELAPAEPPESTDAY
jgi:hypothetical protein